MLKTGFRAFIYSFSVSLFAIIGANKAFLHKQKPSLEALNIQNKTIALYLAKPSVSKAPIKKIALNTLSDIEKPLERTPPLPESEIILASNIEPLTIPLEIVDYPTDTDTTIRQVEAKEENEIVLADVLYAPTVPLPELKIEADPVYTPENGIELQIVDDTVYNPEEIVVAERKITPPPAPNAKKEDNSLILARNETVAEIPLTVSKTNDMVNKIKVGDPQDLQHVAYADTNVSIEAMKLKDTPPSEKSSGADKKWNPMDESPWVVAKSTGSKNVFAAKNYANASDKEIADILVANKDKKGVLLANETAKNLIIPIPKEILDEKDITPQLAYPASSDDKQKEIDINEKIKNSEKLKKAEKEAKESKKDEGTQKTDKKPEETPVLTPIEDEIDKELFDLGSKEGTAPPIEKEPEKQVSQQTGFMDTISSIFNKPKKQISEARAKAVEKLKNKRAKRKKQKNNDDVSIVPTEIRLSFQPNRAEISGQTLRWVQAFATKVAQTSDMILEVRIDGTSSTKLQQKRLNLLYNILTNKGLDYSLINTVFTSRDPNSFVLRTIKIANNKQGVNNQKTNRYIQW